MERVYNPKEIEQKWQKIWDDEKAFAASDDYSKPKYYALVEFPYPSGQGLHVGHPRPYTALDIVARKRRMEGYNVLYPMGWDAFGLPTENYAIKNHIHPKIVTKNNVHRFKEQLHSLGYSFDWDREINTTDPEYYKWTQWIFLKLFKAGLAYKAEMPINWCTSCKVGLANEEVVNGHCERCGAEVIRKVKSQWMLKITEYADKLLEGLDHVDYIERVKVSQKNWIGRSTGAEVDFPIAGKEDKLRIYTTRPDTLFGVTYMVISPEHPYIEKFASEIKNLDEVKAYQEQAARKSDFERSELAKEKTGVKIDGLTAVNPVNGKEIPIWVSDYVLMSYGTGAIMAVPAHDERDWEFAKKFNMPIIQVVESSEGPVDVNEAAFVDVATGKLVNSGFLNGMEVAEAKKAIIEYLEKENIGTQKTNYKLRDWVFSRQRYWGEPIPIVHCDKCGYVPLPEDQLPLELPDVESYMPTDNGESPLAAMRSWVETTCPCCGGPAERETDTMPQWAGSSWYFLRYTDPHNTEALASPEALKYWMPVDWYNGGMEHTTLHLLYSRFWHKFLYDIGVVPSPEPYQKRTAHGMILGLNPHSFVNLPAEEQEKLLKEYGSQKAAEKALEEKYGEMSRHPIVKMSKSLGNVINPDEVVDQYGADTMRLYEMFMGDFEQAAPWQTSAIAGCNRFLDRVWTLSDKLVEGEGYRPQVETLMHQTIKKVGADIETLKMNTAIAQLMTLVNALYDNGGATKAELETVVQLLNPFAPHMTEELWEKLGHSHDEQLAYYPWPQYEEAKCVEAMVEIAVQVNGKVKARLKVAADITSEDAIAAAKAEPAVAEALAGKTIAKEIYVKGRLVNLAVKG